MFNGMPARIATAMVICAQVAAMFFAISLPVPQPFAREAWAQFEVSDIVADEDDFKGDADMEDGASSEGIGESEGTEVVGDCCDEAIVEEGATAPIEEPFEFSPCVADAQSAALTDSQDVYQADQLRTQGVIYDDGYRYTWYSQRVLPGGGLAIDGRHVSEEGYVVDAGERIVVASSDLPYGTELCVPFGSGKAVVLDTGCDSGTIDVYTDF